MYSLTKQQRQAKEGKKVGVVLTIAFHVVLLFVLGVTGFKLIYPPPAEKGILLEIPIEEAMTRTKHLQMDRYKIMELMQFSDTHDN